MASLGNRHCVNCIGALSFFILSNSTRKLLWFEITKMLIAVLKIYCVRLFIMIIIGNLSFPVHLAASIINVSSDTAAKRLAYSREVASCSLARTHVRGKC